MLHARLAQSTLQYAGRHGVTTGLRAYSASASQTVNASPPPRPEHESVRTRKHGGKPLPLPPVLNTAAVEARVQHTRTKALKPEGPKTEFQKAFEANAFAHALATPIRQCSITHARLPSHFLLPVTAILAQRPAKEAEKQLPIPSAALHIGNGDASKVCSPTRSYLLAKKDAVDSIRGGGRKSLSAYLVSERMRTWFGKKTGKREAQVDHRRDFVLEDDAAKKVLDSLRRRVVRLLKSAVRDGYVEVVHGEGETDDEVSCCLWLVCGERDVRIWDRVRSAGAVVVYDLHRLIGEELFSQGSGLSVKAERYIGKNGSRETLQLQMALERLKGFVGPVADD